MHLCWIVGYRFGEAEHPGPMQLRVCSVNITSLYLHFEALLNDYDFLLIQESRLTEFGQVRLRFILMDHHWSAIWGPMWGCGNSL